MTVAAVILSGTTEGALADTAGRAAIRRVVESAWAGGAVPIVVVAPDPDGAVAGALAGSSAVLAAPAPAESGPVGQIVHGVTLAGAEVAGTDAALVWPARLVWVDSETVTSLIEAHGVDRESVLRPAFDGEPGWPVLLPVHHLETLAALPPDRMPDALLDDLAALVPLRSVEVGDPGVTHDRSFPIDALPTYVGPPEPAGGPPPDWGPAAAERGDEPALEGPALAPYGQVAAEDRA